MNALLHPSAHLIVRNGSKTEDAETLAPVCPVGTAGTSEWDLATPVVADCIRVGLESFSVSATIEVL